MHVAGCAGGQSGAEVSHRTVVGAAPGRPGRQPHMTLRPTSRGGARMRVHAEGGERAAPGR